MKVVEEAILSTDLALYFRKKDLFLETANKGEIDWQGDKKDCKYIKKGKYCDLKWGTLYSFNMTCRRHIVVLLTIFEVLQIGTPIMK